MNAGENERQRRTTEVSRLFRALATDAAELLTSVASSPERSEKRRDERDVEGESGRSSRPTNRRNGRIAEQLLTPQERILDLLDANDGRMKQGEIVAAVERSESTVSRKLGELESSGVISRFQIGREKLVFIKGREPDCLDSPFEREDESLAVMN